MQLVLVLEMEKKMRKETINGRRVIWRDISSWELVMEAETSRQCGENKHKKF